MEMENPFLNNQENNERLKFHYSFTNNDVSGHPVIFECEADNPEQAFDLFEERFGKQPNNEDHIGWSSIEH